MSRAENKANRLLQIEALLLNHPEGLSQSEIARRLGVHRSTINRYLPDLPGHIYIDDLDGNKWKVDREVYLVRVRFNLHEALAVHLASRLLATRMDRQNPHAAAGLRKLSVALERLAPRISAHINQSADVMDESLQRHDPIFLGVLEKITLAWAEERKLHIWHQHQESGRVYKYKFSPYFVEPYAVGQSIHTIGHREPPGALRTFKVERIRRAELLKEQYSIPPGFDPRRLLRDAWGIWYTEAEPQTVSLRFHLRVADRLRESRWHGSEEIEENTDGYLIWRAQIAEPREMLPWIRGWGADVEVLEPQELRNELKQEVIKFLQIYQIADLEDQLIAHIRENDKEMQNLWDHLINVSILAEELAAKVHIEKAGKVIGLLHDLGKASWEFQKYIRSAQGLINPDADDYIDPISLKGRIDHSTAGAQKLYEYFSKIGDKNPISAQILALCIASHHSGLIDCLTPSGENNFSRRIRKSESETHVKEAWDRFTTEEKHKIENLLFDANLTKQMEMKLKSLRDSNDSQETYLFKCGLLIRFLLSCLIDADRLDSANFASPNERQIRKYYQNTQWIGLIERLDIKLREFEKKPGKNLVDDLRSQVSQACYSSAFKQKGIYQLTVPTGGGKTLASLRFALNHAAHQKMGRIFYVVPYTTIIDQNADEVRKILEDRDDSGRFLDRIILEHHSNLTPEKETYRQKILTENWEAPIIFTTQVQFLEALFGPGTRSVRRMHQLANSVIILDEVQTVPIKCVHMLNVALRFLVHDCQSTVVLCTATQPPLDNIDSPFRSLTKHLENRIIDNEIELYEKLRRVDVIDRRKVGGWKIAEVANLAKQELQRKGSVLIVVNTKKSARELCLTITQMNFVDVYHLSTNMCPVHRLKVLEEVKEKILKNEPIICVSTQLIEAGVDIDFGSVIRYLAGLDSIAQAAGRCNRNGNRIELGTTSIINPKEENIDRLKEIKIGIEKTKRVLDDFNENPELFDNDRIGLKAMADYYQYYFYEQKDEMTYKVNSDSSVGREDDLFNLLSSNTKSLQGAKRTNQDTNGVVFPQSFKTASQEFKVIASPTRGVIVPYQEEGEELIKDLCGAFEIEIQYKLLRKAQRFSVNLFPFEFEKLAKIDAIQEVKDGTGVYCLNDQYYSDLYGWNDEIFNELKLLIE